MNFMLQLGAQLANPQALTLVSNWGKQKQVTTLQFERRRVYIPCRIYPAHGGKYGRDALTNGGGYQYVSLCS
jgi:hypothetical protein